MITMDEVEGKGHQIVASDVRRAHASRTRPRPRGSRRRRQRLAERRASVTWNGDLMSGSGTIDEVGSGAFGPLDVTWAARTEGAPRVGREDEPRGADRGRARARCFSMALSHGLAQAGNPPERLSTSAAVTFVPGTGITKIALAVRGRVPGLDEDGSGRRPSGRRAARSRRRSPPCPRSRSTPAQV